MIVPQARKSVIAGIQFSTSPFVPHLGLNGDVLFSHTSHPAESFAALERSEHGIHSGAADHRRCDRQHSPCDQGILDEAAAPRGAVAPLVLVVQRTRDIFF
jgi:hypothetical protein